MLWRRSTETVSAMSVVVGASALMTTLCTVAGLYPTRRNVTGYVPVGRFVMV
jgi:hypothetical protein